MTLKKNRAPLLCCFQLCAWFHRHMWIQTGVRVRKRLSWVLTSVTLTFDLWPWPFAWTSLLTMVITPENFMMIRWWEHGEKGVTDRQTDGRTDGLNQSYSCLVAAKKIIHNQYPGNQFPITVMSHMCHGISNHWQLYSLMNSLFRLTAKEHSSSALLALSERNPLDSLHKGPVLMWKSTTVQLTWAGHYLIIVSFLATFLTWWAPDKHGDKVGTLGRPSHTRKLADMHHTNGLVQDHGNSNRLC